MFFPVPVWLFFQFSIQCVSMCMDGRMTCTNVQILIIYSKSKQEMEISGRVSKSALVCYLHSTLICQFPLVASQGSG